MHSTFVEKEETPVAAAMTTGQLRECGHSLVKLFEYNTPLVLHTTSKTIGVIFRLLQLLIFVFIFVYYIGYKRGYQMVSYETTPATRILRKDATKSFAEQIGIPVNDKQHEESRMFYPTTAILIIQNKSTCPEEPRVIFSHCDPGLLDPCPALDASYEGNGVRTGKCVPVRRSRFSFHPQVNHTCQIRGWCTQSEEIHEKVVESFTAPALSVLIENEIHFPQFPSRININNHGGSSSFCWANGQFYHPLFHPLCPIFRLQTIAEEAAKAPGAIPFTYDDLMKTGGLISVEIAYDCNFDVSEESDQCQVNYAFRRLDSFANRTLGSKNPDLDYVHHQEHVGVRVVIHMYGVHLIVMASGVARQFDVFTFLTRLGASAGLFAIAAVFCEFLLMLACCSTEKQTRNMKYVSSNRKDLINL